MRVVRSSQDNNSNNKGSGKVEVEGGDTNYNVIYLPPASMEAQSRRRQQDKAGGRKGGRKDEGCPKLALEKINRDS